MFYKKICSHNKVRSNNEWASITAASCKFILNKFIKINKQLAQNFPKYNLWIKTNFSKTSINFSLTSCFNLVSILTLS